MSPPPPPSRSRLLPGCLHTLAFHSLIRAEQPARLSPAWLIVITTRQRSHADARSWCVCRQLWKTCRGMLRVKRKSSQMWTIWGSQTQKVEYYISAMRLLCARLCGTSAPKTDSRGQNLPWAHQCSGNRVRKTIWVNFCIILDVSEFTNSRESLWISRF